MDQDIVFRAKVDDGGGGQSLTTLRKEFTELNKELAKAEVGSENYLNTLKKLGKVKEELGELRNTINALNPEGKVAAFQNVAGKLAGGFEAATGAAALFGVQSEDLEKTLLKVQAASAFAEGIKSLHGMSDAFKVLGTVIKANPIFALVSVLTAVVGAVVALTNETGKLEKEIQKETETINTQIKVIDRQLKIMEAQGATDAQLLELKKQKINLQIKEIETSVKLQKEQLKELANGASLLEQLGNSISFLTQSNVLQNKRFEDAAKAAEVITKSESDIADLKTELTVAEIKAEKSKQEEYKKTADKKKEAAEEAAAAEEYWNQVTADNDEAVRAAHATRLGEESKEKIKAAEEEAALFNQLFEDDKARLDAAGKEQTAARKKKLAEEEALAKQIQSMRDATEQRAFAAAQNLSKTFFANKLLAAKGNATAELEIRKKQFQVEKAFNVARATIDGARAVTAALTLPPPAGPLLAAANAVVAAAQVAAILATNFDGGNASFANIQSPSVSAPASAPDVGTRAPTIHDQTTSLSESGQNLSINITNHIAESEMTERQKRVNRLQSQAKVG